MFLFRFCTGNQTGYLCHCWAEKKKRKRNREVAGLKLVVVKLQLLPPCVSDGQAVPASWGDGTGVELGCGAFPGSWEHFGAPVQQRAPVGQAITPCLSFPSREAVQLAGAGAAAFPLLPQAALSSTVMPARWGARGGSPGAGCPPLPPHTAVTPGLCPAGGQGPGAGVREPGWVDVPDQSGGRSRPELPELHPPGLVFG